MELDEIKERMATGQLYSCDSVELASEQAKQLDLQFEYNSLRPSQQEEKRRLLKEMFAEIGENCYIETPLHANWGGKFVHLGNNVYANFNLTLVDDCEITIGDCALFGPNVVLCTGTHPVHPELRSKQIQYNLPITIGRNVWIGANSVVLPGVTIGENTVVGAGSIVTKSLPANVVAVGSPCRVLREIGDKDMKYYHGNLQIPSNSSLL